ncbi:hypothetical protein AXF42_Ash018617 [Apostasia shenzhenica]|uniref:Uncharacterized protein n=1 Tax=Apostasia shenzhenica TaxID=1088818 RepID=A0A2I0B1G3_9ASPA|nr:hypothetical protein AXF42_Ash018617 [Apostasia shenzhenica]
MLGSCVQGITGSKYLASVAESWSYRAKSNTDKGIREDKKEDKQRNIFMGSLNDKKYENVSKRLLGNNVRDSDHDCQAFSKDFKKAFSEQDVDPAMLFYKNLWIQTEAALWSMKHDVALMKLEMENFKHLWKADCGEETDKLKKLKNVMILPEPATSNSMSEHDLHSCIEHGGSGKVRSASSEDSSESKTVEKNHRFGW